MLKSTRAAAIAMPASVTPGARSVMPGTRIDPITFGVRRIHASAVAAKTPSTHHSPPVSGRTSSWAIPATGPPASFTRKQGDEPPPTEHEHWYGDGKPDRQPAGERDLFAK